MASKSGLASFLFMILTWNVLCTELSNAADTIIRQGQKLHGDSLVSCQMEGKHFVKKHGFINITDIQFTINMNESLGIHYCRDRCWGSCSCIAYQSIYIKKRPRWCAFYQGILDVIDDPYSAFEIYILNPDTSNVQPHIPPSSIPAGLPVGNPKGSTAEEKWLLCLLGAVPPAIAMGLVAVLCYLRTRKAKSSGTLVLKEEELGKGDLMFSLGTEIRLSYILSDSYKLEKFKKTGDEMQVFSFGSIWTATNEFSSANKLGEGGFGPVYKGNLLDGQEIAVKRLSTSSSQGIVEFENEMTLIVQLHHTNLVRLLGCCIEGGEKMLVYEFLLHKSLDSFLFDSTKKKLLDWEKRLEIIKGIAQGLLYLHKYSRLKVIHRDLKTSNILLDSKLNPKISDFGLARIFGQNKSEAKTNKVVGTYGYMAPEYAMEGLYSEKSDVFSFGVIILEIMSGMKTTSLSATDCSLNIIAYAWDLWKEGKSSDIIDQTIGGASSREELLRYIHVALLCVEESVSDRPTMPDVVYMLTNGNTLFQALKQPAFYNWRSKKDAILQEHDLENCSLNFVSISPIEGR